MSGENGKKVTGGRADRVTPLTFLTFLDEGKGVKSVKKVTDQVQDSVTPFGPWTPGAPPLNQVEHRAERGFGFVPTRRQILAGYIDPGGGVVEGQVPRAVRRLAEQGNSDPTVEDIARELPPISTGDLDLLAVLFPGVTVEDPEASLPLDEVAEYLAGYRRARARYQPSRMAWGKTWRSGFWKPASEPATDDEGDDEGELEQLDLDDGGAPHEC